MVERIQYAGESSEKVKMVEVFAMCSNFLLTIKIFYTMDFAQQARVKATSSNTSSSYELIK